MADLVSYPAVFEPNESGYIVYVPDIPSAFTEGADLIDAQQSVNDLIATMLVDEDSYPVASLPNKIDLSKYGEGAFIVFALVDIEEWKMQHQKVHVQVTIPKYLRDAAKKNGINMSQTLSNALFDKVAHAG